MATPNLVHPNRSTVVCPICLARFDWNRAPLFSLRDGADIEGITFRDYRRLQGSSKSQAAEILESQPVVRCGGAADYLSLDYNDQPQVLIAVVGATASSKTTYLAALIKTMLDGVASSISMRPMAGSDHERLDREHIQPLFVDRQVLGATASGERLLPLIYELTNQVTGDKFSVVFTDVAGEELANPSSSARIRFLGEADGVIVLIDSTTVPDLAEAIGRGRPRPGGHHGAIASLISMKSQLDRDRMRDGMTMVPASVVMAKADLLTDADPIVQGWLDRDECDGGARDPVLLDRQKLGREALDVAQLLIDYKERHLLDLVGNSFWSFTLHFASATGTDVVTGDGSSDPATYRQSPAPKRALRPFLSILDRLELLADGQASGKHQLPPPRRVWR